MKQLITALAHPRDYVWLALRPWRRHGLVLAVAGAVYVFIGWTYVMAPADSSRESSLRVPLEIAPLSLWGIAWLSVGLLGVLSSRWPPASEKWGYTLMSALAALWACFYVAGIILGGSPQALSGALVWALVAFLWWAVSGLDNPHRPVEGDGL